MRRLRHALVLLLFASLAGCTQAAGGDGAATAPGSDKDPDGGASSAAATLSPSAADEPAGLAAELDVAPPAELDVAPPAELDFALPSVDGGQVDGSSLAGRDVALWFWAPW